MKQRLITLGNALAVFAALLLLWQLVLWIFHVPPYMLPSPLAVARSVGARFPSLLTSFAITAEESAGGLIASVVFGVLIALVFAQSRWVRRMLYPYTLLLQTVPIVAVAPLILMWVGSGAPAVTLIAFIISLAPIIANTTQGLISVDENLVHLFLMHNASPAQLLFKLRLPHAVPSLFVGIRIASGIAVIGAITGELYAGSSSVGQGGLGYSILYASSQLQTDYLFALVLAATVLGFSFFFLVMFLEWYFLHKWHESARAPRDGIGGTNHHRGNFMLRLETETGWWLVTHPDHARLAGAFAEKWGNDRFLPPEPRENVLKGIARHDDGWIARDAAPQITSQGKPSAFSVELVGKYSAFEEIDLADYLAVRDRAVRAIAEEDAYAALLISMHTYNLLTAHADRSTIVPAQLPLLDQFLDQQKALQQSLRLQIIADTRFTPDQKTEATVLDHFRLLQASDNLSLLTCVNFSAPSSLLHTLPLRDGTRTRVEVKCAGPRHFLLDPYPFDEPSLHFSFPARHVKRKLFSSAAELQKQFASAPVEMLSVTVTG